MTTMLSSSRSGWSRGSGSGSVTSRAAQWSLPARIVSSSASWSITPPRAALTSTADSFISPSSRAPIMPRVSSVRGMFSATKSDCVSSSSSVT